MLVLGPLLWALHFVVVYGVTGVVCAKIEAPDALVVLRVVIGAATVVAMACIIFVGVKSWRQWSYLDGYDHEHEMPVGEHRHEFLGHAAFLLSVLSALAVLYTAMPAVFIGTCS